MADKEKKPELSTDEKIQQHVDKIKDILEKEARAKGKTENAQAFDKLVGPVISAIEKGKASLDDKKIGDLASTYSRIPNPKKSDTEKLIRILARRWFDMKPDEKSSKSSESVEES